MWEPDRKLALEANSKFEELLARFAAAHDDQETAEELLETAGRLCLVREQPQVAAATDRHPGIIRWIETALSQIDFGPVEVAAMEVVRLAPRVDLVAGSEREALVAGIERALGIRDEAELMLCGARFLLGASRLTDEQSAHFLEFELLLRPELWRLVALGERRADGVSWVAPEHRPAFWWRHQGSDVAQAALDHLSSAAHLIACFPEARAELERLVEAEALLSRGQVDRSANGPRAPGGAVVRLADFIAERRRDPGTEHGHEISLAAGFAPPERTLVEREDFQVSWEAPDRLLVDLVADRAEGRLPFLEADGRTLTAEPVSGCEERFEIRLDEAALRSSKVVLRIPLRSEVVSVWLTSDFTGR